MTQFVFDQTIVGPPDMAETWVFNDRDRPLLKNIRSNCPELAHWSDAHLLAGWGSFSGDIMAIGWVDPSQFNIDVMSHGFMAYLYVRQLVPSFKFPGCGIFDDEVFALGEEVPWHGDAHTPPAWVHHA